MTHVRIDSRGLTVDGVHIPVHANDFKVDLRDLPRATVTCTIPADMIDIDLPEAVVNATPSYGVAFAVASAKVAEYTTELAALNATLEAIVNGGSAGARRGNR